MTSEILHALIAATPAPSTTDPDALLAEFAEVHARRAMILAAVVAPLTPGPSDHALRQTLAAREAAWHAALGAARDQTREHRIAATRVKTYTSTPAR